jgi:hypothetical protein
MKPHTGYTSLVKEDELQEQIPQENKLDVIPQLTRKTTVNFQTKDKKRVFIIHSLIVLVNCVLLTLSLQLFAFQFYLNGR